jgi:hypothetical protein
MSLFFDRSRYFLALFIGLSIPISTALTNILCPFALLFILADRNYKQKLNDLRTNPIALSALLLFAVMLLGVFIPFAIHIMNI